MSGARPIVLTPLSAREKLGSAIRSPSFPERGEEPRSTFLPLSPSLRESSNTSSPSGVKSTGILPLRTPTTLSAILNFSMALPATSEGSISALLHPRPYPAISMSPSLTSSPCTPIE